MTENRYSNAKPSKMAERVYKIRTKQGLTAKELDRKADLSPGHVTAIENGMIRNPSTDTVVKLARALGVSNDELLA